MANTSEHRVVFVGNIPYKASESQIIQICEEVGPVVSFRLVLDKETGKPKGFGFCEYRDEETALSALRNLKGYEFNGRQLRVNFAEKDKGKGRGGAGSPSNKDAQISIGGPGYNQPIGLPRSSTSTSVMAGDLGGVQTDSMRAMQSDLQIPSDLANDPLTLHLASMSMEQLYDIMSEMKEMTSQNAEMAHQLFSLCPLLPKALFQAQVMKGMVPTEVLQTSNIQQSPTSVLQHPAQDGVQCHNLTGLPPMFLKSFVAQDKMQLGMMPSGHGPQNALMNNQHPVLPFQQQHPQQALNQPFIQTKPSQPGILTGMTRNSNLHLGTPGGTCMTRNNVEPSHHPSKLVRLEDGRSAIRTMVSQNNIAASGSGPTPVLGTSSVLTNIVPGPEKVQNSDKQMLHLEPDVRSALLEQVKSLTPEQLSSLPPEERQQVFDLQKMLR